MKWKAPLTALMHCAHEEQGNKLEVFAVITFDGGIVNFVISNLLSLICSLYIVAYVLTRAHL